MALPSNEINDLLSKCFVLDGSGNVAIRFVSSGFGTDSVKEQHIDWGTGSEQVSAVDMPIEDSGGYFTATDIEAALAELAQKPRYLVLKVNDADTDAVVGDGVVGIPIPPDLNGWEIKDVIVTVSGKGVTGTMDVQIRRKRAGADVDVLSTKVTVGDEYFANDGVINAANDDLATADYLYADIDVIHTTAAKGTSIICEIGPV